MDINLARTFLAIIETGNFNRAAEQVNVTQSTVSMRIKTLETVLGRPLFTRSKAGTSLTAAGIHFQKYAQSLIRIWEQARHELSLPPSFEGVLTIGVQHTLWDNLILKWIPRMQSAAPDVALRAEVGISRGIMRQLADGFLDLAVMYMPQSRPGLVIEELMSEKLALISSDPKTSGPGEPGYIYVDWGPEFLQNIIIAYPNRDSPALTVNHGPLGLQHILRNGGSGYFPLRFISKHLESGRLHLIEEKREFNRPIFMVYSSDNNDPHLETARHALRHVASLNDEG
ncbi:MAG: LysR family transcriptional regulator [Rhodospirillales bacterium RIFCSPLOWO2_12_FULL_58_28]|nr:MAG: LysR family transcriptional regulator [Rhodospirillales bacterium RIFCSPLOWO2_02_FULL_58_16]OHC78630.1 MAG: LysR family transcriptional regulator [Rhodospirillales bacterium RIFCSPLOWO2_12_FULL_58_28]